MATVFFIDFEGEPARPIAERRVPQSPLRDVAGMLRSFGYAARAGLRTFLETNPDGGPTARAVDRRLGDAGRGALSETLPQSHRRHGAAAARANRDLLLRALLLDKAFYELSYELNNRPDWVDIPLDGLLRLLEPPPGGR